MKLQAEWRDRLRYWTHLLTQDFYTPIGEISFEGFPTFEQLTAEDAEKRQFSPISVGAGWGMEWQYLWLRSRITLPESARGQIIVLNLNPGGESTLFVDGRAFGTRRAEWVTVPHHMIQDNILSESGEPGRSYDLLIEAYAGHYFPQGHLRRIGTGPVLPGTLGDPLEGKERTALGRSTFGVWNEQAYQLWMDVVTLTEVMENLSDGSLRAAKIAKALMDFTLAVDFEQPPEARHTDYEKGRDILRPALAAVNGSTAPVFYGIGNSHLDIVWLWPYQETERKTARTFAQQLRLLDKYPDYKYLQSQPLTYQMCRERYPELYARVKKAIADGRWIAEGAMWVEPDTNMTSGESLIRQLLYGMRFFREEFGVQCETLWLPDTFGYTAALPQILKSFGIKYLVTQKIFWSYNEGERFPYHYFTWQGMDGSEITSYLPTNYTYPTNPSTLMNLWENRVQKDEMDKFLLPYGYGDGGGGPTRDYIEFGLRQKDFEGAPRFKMASPGELFRDLEADGGPVHKYVGELYFTAHRGVYTSQANVKKGNRKSELALRRAELWSALACTKTGHKYPAGLLEELWKSVLLNQFHDILPGSSIARVYKEAAVLHDDVIVRGGELARQAELALAGGGTHGITVFNELSWPRKAVVELPDAFARGAKTTEGERIPTTQSGGKTLAAVTLPSCGTLALVPDERAEQAKNSVSATTIGSGFVLENGKIRAVIDQSGELISFILKSSGRELASAPMNRFMLFKDVPRVFDAWDIDSPYELQPVPVSTDAEITIIEQSTLRAAVRVEKVVGNSRISQDIVLEYESERLEFHTTVDWRELHRLLKVGFPVNVHTVEAYNEMQFGYVKRPTHRSRQYDKDRFEVCNHRYTALCDESHGAAVLNDCKYGVSMLDGSINLTLLRAAATPEMRADNGLHHFVYAFTAWDGPFAGSYAVRQGYELNIPASITAGSGKSESFFSVSHENIVLETLKLAEDGSGDLIVRLYDCKGADTRAELCCGLDIASAFRCEMDERVIEPLAIDGGKTGISFKPFQVATLRLKLE